MFSHSAWHKKRFAENAEYREKIRAAQRRYRQKHKEEMTERRRRKWQTDAAYREQQRARDREWKRRKRYEVYGMSLADYEAMLERQRGACAICKKSDEALCVDHCHACGKVRGLLCAKCNSALGFCNDSPEHLLAAMLAGPELARKIIDDVVTFSAPFGTAIDFKDGIGIVRVGAAKSDQ